MPLAAGRWPLAAGCWLLPLSDDGLGLSVIAIRFDAEETVPGARPRRRDLLEQGTGLRLFICQRMIGAHGGSVEALLSKDGVGALIRVTLPLTSVPEQVADREES